MEPDPPAGQRRTAPVQDGERAAVARRGRRPLAVLVLAAVVLVAVLAVVGLLVRDRGGGQPAFTGSLSAPRGGRDHRVTAWITSTTRPLGPALTSGALDEVDCDWYTIGADGSVNAGPENLALVRSARDHGLQTFATVTNRPGSSGSFEGSIAKAILTDTAVQRQAVSSLVDLAVSKGYDGIDVDFELVPAAQRDAFSGFMAELAAALHDQHRLLSVAVFAKTSEPGRWDAQKSADYAALGKVVDELKVMTYSYSGPWGDPGPQAPLAWTRDVLRFAQSVVPPQKVYMGLPFYGFDWHGGKVTALHAAEAAALVEGHHFKVDHNAASGEADLSYVDPQGVTHVLWFQDRHAIATKVALLQHEFPKLGGLAIWELRDEDPGFWPIIQTGLGGTVATPNP
ncbi:MAG TPA: glycosyl hydrolase family 18 protein [Thermoleophilia bacterium]|nr:glycosyl hydrolase family 18 protein [Thermoleophilia bacterium]